MEGFGPDMPEGNCMLERWGLGDPSLVSPMPWEPRHGLIPLLVKSSTPLGILTGVIGGSM